MASLRPLSVVLSIVALSPHIAAFVPGGQEPLAGNFDVEACPNYESYATYPQ